MPEARSPTVRRRELGVLLRALRNERGWTVDHVAKRLLCSASKISRLETGQRGASPRDIRDLCDLYEVGEDERQRLLALARQGKERAWWQPLGLPYSTYVGLEAEASSISDFGIGIVPGLMQTADYARAVLRAAQPNWAPAVIEQRVAGRIARQQVLASRKPPRFEALVDESALHRVVGGPDVMRAQCERMLKLSDAPNIVLRVIPYAAGALPALNKFIILAFALSTVPDVVYVEGLTGDLYLDNAEDVEDYKLTFWAIRELALSEDRTRAMMDRMMTAYR